MQINVYPFFTACYEGSWPDGQWRTVYFATKWSAAAQWLLRDMADYVNGFHSPETAGHIPAEWITALELGQLMESIKQARIAAANVEKENGVPVAFVGGMTAPIVGFAQLHTGDPSESGPWNATYTQIWEESSRLELQPLRVEPLVIRDEVKRWKGIN